jgi:hypothetical protein
VVDAQGLQETGGYFTEETTVGWVSPASGSPRLGGFQRRPRLKEWRRLGRGDDSDGGGLAR